MKRLCVLVAIATMLTLALAGGVAGAASSSHFKLTGAVKYDGPFTGGCVVGRVPTSKGRPPVLFVQMVLGADLAIRFELAHPAPYHKFKFTRLKGRYDGQATLISGLGPKAKNWVAGADLNGNVIGSGTFTLSKRGLAGSMSATLAGELNTKKSVKVVAHWRCPASSIQS